jgi:hypothetical protein
VTKSRTGALSPRERIRVALRGGTPDRVPFSVYWLMFPRAEAERTLRNAGVAIVERVPLFTVEYPSCELVTREYRRDGRPVQRRELRTPVGTIWAEYRREQSYRTSWWQTEFYVKSPADYDVLEYLLLRRTYRPSYEEFLLAESRYGQDGYVIGNTEYSPMNLLLYELLGIERFSLDLADRPERVLALYDILRERQRRMFEICADSPAELVLFCGNISQEVVGVERFRRYYLPCLNELAGLLHQEGKLLGCHLDARMANLVEAVGESALDVIEAFTPVPTGDVSVAAARAAWSDKVLWINFPSSVHMEGEERIRGELARILQQAAPGDRFLIGITEDVPEEHWRGSFRAINEGLDRFGWLPVGSLPVSPGAAGPLARTAEQCADTLTIRTRWSIVPVTDRIYSISRTGEFSCIGAVWRPPRPPSTSW